MNDDDLIAHLVVGNFDPPEPAPQQPPNDFARILFAVLLGICLLAGVASLLVD